MKAITRISTGEYEYLELQEETTSVEEAIELHNRAVSVYKSQEGGLSPKEWRDCLVRYLESSEMDVECHERMNKAQKWLVSELDRAFNRIKYKESK